MNWAGKIIGMVLGLIFAGPIGLFAGLLIGHLLDQVWLRHWLSKPAANHSHQSKNQEVFFNNTFRVMGNIAKSDGRVSENEIQQVRLIMQQMGLNDALKQEAIRCFNEGKNPQFNLRNAIDQLKRSYMFQPMLLRVFLEMQIQVAYADNQQLSDHKRQLLQMICRQLGISPIHFQEFEQRYRSQYQHRRSTGYAQNSASELADAYKTLGISNNANDGDIKKAYRRLMSRHHPDKLVSKGLPPDMLKLATQKTQQIKTAYEKIRKARNWSL